MTVSTTTATAANGNSGGSSGGNSGGNSGGASGGAAGGHARKALVVLATLTGLAILLAYVTATDLRDRVEVVRQKKSELRALLQRAGGRGAMAAGAQADPFLQGANSSLASNALQERVVRLIEDVGGNVISVNVEQSTGQAEPAGKRLVLQVMAEMTVEAAQRVLHRLEGEAPALIVESLLVDRRTTGSTDSEDATRPTRLRIDARIAGFTRAGGP